MSEPNRPVGETRADVLSAPLFAYGTLQLDAVLNTLLGRVPSKEPAELAGWRAVQLPERPYPGLVQHRAFSAAGYLITGLSVEEWMLLDRFEDPDYDLRQVEVNGTRAWAYAWRERYIDADWDLGDFAAVELPRYVRRCAAWLERDRARC